MAQVQNRYGGDTEVIPRDLDRGWSLAADMERDLIPFQVHADECESQFVAKLFANFLTLYIIINFPENC